MKSDGGILNHQCHGTKTKFECFKKNVRQVGHDASHKLHLMGSIAKQKTNHIEFNQFILKTINKFCQLN